MANPVITQNSQTTIHDVINDDINIGSSCIKLRARTSSKTSTIINKWQLVPKKIFSAIRRKINSDNIKFIYVRLSNKFSALSKNASQY